MTDPYNQLREQLTNLIKNGYFYIQGLRDQLDRIAEWETPTRREALRMSSWFFSHVVYTFARTVLVELCKLVTPREDRSLIKWLKQAHTHAEALRPTRWTRVGVNGETREVISVEEYRALIEDQLAAIDAMSGTVDNIKARRDKAIAHADKRYYDDPQRLHGDFPLDAQEVTALADLIGEILRTHHVHLFESDLNMRVTSGRHVDVVLRYARAFARARKDKDLIQKGFRPIDYTHDEQDARDNPLF